MILQESSDKILPCLLKRCGGSVTGCVDQCSYVIHLIESGYDWFSPQMPPKKGGDGPKQPPLIGRFGTSLKIGIVGLPNVGYVLLQAVILGSCMCAMCLFRHH